MAAKKSTKPQHKKINQNLRHSMHHSSVHYSNWKTFLDSFKSGKVFLKTCLMDCAMCILLFLILLVWILSLKSLSPLLGQAISPFANGMPQQPSPQLFLASESAQAWFYYAAAFTIIGIILCLFVYFLFQFLIYKTVNKDKKFNVKFFAKFSLLSFLTIIIILIIILLLQFAFFALAGESFTQSAFLQILFMAFQVICFIIFSFFAISLFLLFVKTEKIKEALRQFWQISIKKFGFFVKPMLFVLAVFAVANIVLYFTLLLPELVSTILILIIFIAFFAWLRIYYNLLVKIKNG